MRADGNAGRTIRRAAAVSCPGRTVVALGEARRRDGDAVEIRRDVAAVDRRAFIRQLGNFFPSHGYCS